MSTSSIFLAERYLIKLLVSYNNGKVSVTPASVSAGTQRVAKVIAQSEHIMAQMEIDHGSKSFTFDTLLTYFEKRGWRVTVQDPTLST